MKTTSVPNELHSVRAVEVYVVGAERVRLATMPKGGESSR